MFKKNYFIANVLLLNSKYIQTQTRLKFQLHTKHHLEKKEFQKSTFEFELPNLIYVLSAIVNLTPATLQQNAINFKIFSAITYRLVGWLSI